MANKKIYFIEINKEESIFMRVDDLEVRSDLFEVTVEKRVDGEWEEVYNGNFLENIEKDSNATAWRIDMEEYRTYEEMMASSWEDCFTFNGNGYDSEEIVAGEESRQVALTFVKRGEVLSENQGVATEWEEIWKNPRGEEIVVTVSNANLQNSATLYEIFI